MNSEFRCLIEHLKLLVAGNDGDRYKYDVPDSNNMTYQLLDQNIQKSEEFKTSLVKRKSHIKLNNFDSINHISYLSTSEGDASDMKSELSYSKCHENIRNYQRNNNKNKQNRNKINIIENKNSNQNLSNYWITKHNSGKESKITRKKKSISCVKDIKTKFRRDAEDLEAVRSSLTFDHICLMIQAICILYKERLRPFWRDVQHQLEYLQCDEFLAKNYCLAYESLPNMFKLAEKSESVPWCVYLVGTDESLNIWIDPYSPDPPYSEEIWEIFIRHIVSSIQNSNNLVHEFHGGRYLMAKYIRDTIPEMRELTLGHTCHLIQRAVDTGFLAYENDTLQPTSNCFKFTYATAISLGFEIKDQNEYLSDNKGNNLNERNKDAVCPARSIQEAKKYISGLIEKHPHGLLIGTFKTQMVKMYNTYINATNFGYTRLSHFLASSEFSNICRIFQDRKNSLFIQSVNYPMPPSAILLTKSARTVRKCKNVFTVEETPDISFTYWCSKYNKRHGIWV